jgi:hypothetical protein
MLLRRAIYPESQWHSLKEFLMGLHKVNNENRLGYKKVSSKYC